MKIDLGELFKFGKVIFSQNVSTNRGRVKISLAFSLMTLANELMELGT
jgi:hypothetical protein